MICLVAFVALFLSASQVHCKTTAENDAKQAGKELEKTAEKVAKDVEKAVSNATDPKLPSSSLSHNANGFMLCCGALASVAVAFL